MLGFARERNPEVHFVMCPAEDLALPGDQFDFVFSSVACHHFEDKDRAFDEIVRVLKLDGLIKLTNICPDYMQDTFIY